MGFTKDEVVNRVLKSFDFDEAFRISVALKHDTYKSKEEMIEFARYLVGTFIDLLEEDMDHTFVSSGRFTVERELYDSEKPRRPAIVLNYVPLSSDYASYIIKTVRRDERVPF